MLPEFFLCGARLIFQTIGIVSCGFPRRARSANLFLDLIASGVCI